MRGFIQLTPIPDHLDKDEEVLDRIVKAVDGGDDQSERREAFLAQERKAFQEWSGVDDISWRVSFLRGYPTLFMCFTGPRIKNEIEPKPPIEEKLDGFLSSLAADVVYGDTGCILNGVPFSSRARWTVTDEPKKGLMKVSVTDSDGKRDMLDHDCVGEEPMEGGRSAVPVLLLIATLGLILGLVVSLVLRG